MFSRGKAFRQIRLPRSLPRPIPRDSVSRLLRVRPRSLRLVTALLIDIPSGANSLLSSRRSTPLPLILRERRNLSERCEPRDKNHRALGISRQPPLPPFLIYKQSFFGRGMAPSTLLIHLRRRPGTSLPPPRFFHGASFFLRAPFCSF